MNSLERRSLPWVIQVGPKCNHTYPYAREAEGVWILTYGREDLGKMEAGIAMLSHKPGSCQKLEETREDSPLKP